MATIRILLSNKLGELRWTQAELARKTEIRANTINEYYHELTDRINLRHFEKICEVMRCEFTDIVVCEEDQQPKSHPRTGKKNNKPN